MLVADPAGEAVVTVDGAAQVGTAQVGTALRPGRLWRAWVARVSAGELAGITAVAGSSRGARPQTSQ